MSKKILTVFALVFVLSLSVTSAYAWPFGPDFDAVQDLSDTVYTNAWAVEQNSAGIISAAESIQATETDPEVVASAAQIIALATQTQQDAAAIMALADDINTRIDNSEGTTLQLAYEIGIMADRIGEMANRILWTQLQIGIMADRIVESEYLISDSTLALTDSITTINGDYVGLANNIVAATVQIVGEL